MRPLPIASLQLAMMFLVGLADRKARASVALPAVALRTCLAALCVRIGRARARKRPGGEAALRAHPSLTQRTQRAVAPSATAALAPPPPPLLSPSRLGDPAEAVTAQVVAGAAAAAACPPPVQTWQRGGRG
jgi:hypothetical protein